MAALETKIPISCVSFEPPHIAAARVLWEQSEGVGLSSADEPKALTRFLQRNPGLSFVAMQGAQVVGTILCGHDGRRGLIHHLVVAQTARRLGVGRHLLQLGLAALSTESIQKAHLLVFKSNEPGLAFWRAVGAEERSALTLFSLATEDTECALNTANTEVDATKRLQQALSKDR